MSNLLNIIAPKNTLHFTATAAAEKIKRQLAYSINKKNFVKINISNPERGNF